MTGKRELVSTKSGNLFSDLGEQVLRWGHLRPGLEYLFKVDVAKSEVWGNPRGSFYKLFGAFQHDSGEFIRKDNPCWLYLPRSTFKKELERFPILQQLKERDPLMLGFSKVNNKRVKIFQCELLR